MGKLIDADKLTETITYSCSMGGVMGKVVDAVYEYAKHMVETQPEAVVRCKDCKKSEYDFMCNCYWCKGQGKWRVVEADGYCSEGKKR